MIKIENLIPLLKEGWVAMDENEVWCWFEEEPHRESSINGGYWQSNASVIITNYCLQDIAPVKDWTQSLIKIERKYNE